MSISLIAVFIPLLLMADIPGRLLREFAVTLSIAVAVSMVTSLTVTPMMCARILRSPKTAVHGKVYEVSERIFNLMRNRYEITLRWALSRPRLMLSLVFACLLLSIGLFIISPKGFFPEQDTGRITGSIIAEQDISFQAMEKKLKQVVDIIKSDRDVENVAGFTGGGGGGGATINTARLFIALKAQEKRKSTASEVIGRLRKRLNQVPGAPTYLQVVQELRIGGRMSGAMYQYTLKGEDLDILNTWSPRILREARKLSSLVDVNSDQQDKGLEATLAIDRDTASRLGITPQTIDDALYDAFGQRQVSITYTYLNQYHTIMEVAPAFWQRPETLRDIYVPAKAGAMAPLSAFCRFERNTTSLAVNHQSQFPAVTISFNLFAGQVPGRSCKRDRKCNQSDEASCKHQGQLSGHCAGISSRSGYDAFSHSCRSRGPFISCWVCFTKAMSIPLRFLRPCRRQGSGRSSRCSSFVPISASSPLSALSCLSASLKRTVS